MKKHKYNIMQILEKNGKIILRYINKINKKTVKRKNKSGTVNTFYQGVMPQEIIDYFQVEDKRIFFYKYNDEIRITSRRPKVEHQEIKIQRQNQYSLPKSFFNPGEYSNVVLQLDLSKVDDYKNGLGVLTITLI